MALSLRLERFGRRARTCGARAQRSCLLAALVRAVCCLGTGYAGAIRSSLHSSSAGHRPPRAEVGPVFQATTSSSPPGADQALSYGHSRAEVTLGQGACDLAGRDVDRAFFMEIEDERRPHGGARCSGREVVVVRLLPFDLRLRRMSEGGCMG
eukprot:3719008-Pleurochrysis_carterae.AAC.1